ncbi:unnamed protein product [Ilex paraguariensis]|uniref:Uncharacterized protein n=1 Tax=Ilex paraguariensis TaxID=185542 RepID=A0ABC8RFI5_9AQUA
MSDGQTISFRLIRHLRVFPLSNAEKSDRLKTSFAETLTRFYPLAGRLINNIAIDCNDEGIMYLEAWAKCQLSQVIQNPNPGEFNKFLPREVDDVDDTLLAIQVNFFNCGGMAVGFESAKLFPPRNLFGYETSIGIPKDKLVMKRFVLNHSMVAALRYKYTTRPSMKTVQYVQHALRHYQLSYGTDL